MLRYARLKKAETLRFWNVVAMVSITVQMAVQVLLLTRLLLKNCVQIMTLILKKQIRNLSSCVMRLKRRKSPKPNTSQK